MRPHIIKTSLRLSRHRSNESAWYDMYGRTRIVNGNLDYERGHITGSGTPPRLRLLPFSTRNFVMLKALALVRVPFESYPRRLHFRPESIPTPCVDAGPALDARDLAFPLERTDPTGRQIYCVIVVNMHRWAPDGPKGPCCLLCRCVVPDGSSYTITSWLGQHTLLVRLESCLLDALW